MTKVFGNVEKLSETSHEITFSVNNEQALHFKTFFDDFDKRMRDYDISSYGIAMTSLEEVFLTVNENDEQKT